MKKFNLFAFFVLFAVSILGQVSADQSKTVSSKTSNAEVLAQETFKAHGGEKFKLMKTLSVLGDVDVTVSAFNQAFPAKFATIIAGDKYRLEINSQFVNFKQIFDGQRTYTSPERGVNLPPVNRLGPFLLQRLGDEGFTVSNLTDQKKTGFRITSPEGYYSDFFVDKKTKRIKGYEAKYLVDGREVTTLVEINKFEEKEGIVIPSKYAQRFEVGQLTVYAQFKATEVTINQEIANGVFAP